MKKKVFLFSILILFLILILPFTFAAQEDIDNAFACLEDKIDEKKCEGLSTSEKIFSILATGRCKSELNTIADADGCWPDGNCDLKTTAQALLALEKTSTENWLFEQNGTPSEITWFLQIEITGADSSACKITYDESDYNIEIGEDKKINSAAGSCLSLSSPGYWLEISSNCYDEEFEISCDEGFLTNLLFSRDSFSEVTTPPCMP